MEQRPLGKMIGRAKTPNKCPVKLSEAPSRDFEKVVQDLFHQHSFGRSNELGCSHCWPQMGPSQILLCTFLGEKAKAPKAPFIRWPFSDLSIFH